MPKKNASVYFPGLNTLRFFAAFLVFLSHVEQFKQLFGFRHYYGIKAVHQVGNLAVTFFFVLSGFLITYLLFKEREVTHTISIKNFYIRRLLRIWPLYYLLVVVTLFVLPNFFSGLYTSNLLTELYTDFNQKVLLFALFLPQVVLIRFSRVIYLEPSWSIGIEEQFYLFWPVLVKYFKKFLPLMIGIILFIFGLRGFAFIITRITDNEVFVSIGEFIRDYFYFARFQSMAIGALGAYVLYHKKNKILNFVFNRWVQWSIILSLTFFLLTGFDLFRITHEFYSVFFIILTLNIAANPKRVINLEMKPFNYLGKISYGIYMYHEIAIGISIWLFTKIFHFYFEDMLSFSLLYLVSFILTITISALSYHLFEEKFLRLKGAFSKVQSGDSVAPSRVIPIELGTNTDKTQP